MSPSRERDDDARKPSWGIEMEQGIPGASDLPGFECCIGIVNWPILPGFDPSANTLSIRQFRCEGQFTFHTDLFHPVAQFLLVANAPLMEARMRGFMHDSTGDLLGRRVLAQNKSFVELTSRRRIDELAGGTGVSRNPDPFDILDHASVANRIEIAYQLKCCSNLVRSFTAFVFAKNDHHSADRLLGARLHGQPIESVLPHD